jgi:hypothetical protein
MLSNLFGDRVHKHRAVASLVDHVESLRRSRRQTKGRASR